ncbi:MAG: DUF4013 domain-containing protein [Chloroflexi bacterium]|nr:DUF4013 domain-containing protein [Chloroflexota bacterium]
MDFGKSFTFMFEDPNWVRKLGIGTLVTLAGIFLSPVLIGLAGVFMLMGYGLDVVRNVLDGKEHPLPEWEDWGGFLIRGLKIFGVYLLWCLPFIIVAIPLGIGAALTSDNGRGVLEALGILITICGSCLAILYGLFLTLITPAIYIRLAATDRFAAAFEIGRLWALTRDNLDNVIIALILGYIVAGIISVIIAFLGVFAILIGLLVSLPFAILWQYLVQGHLFGQIGAHSVTPAE